MHLYLCITRLNVNIVCLATLHFHWLTLAAAKYISNVCIGDGNIWQAVKYNRLANWFLENMMDLTVQYNPITSVMIQPAVGC